jgi:hypothetical protein
MTSEELQKWITYLGIKRELRQEEHDRLNTGEEWSASKREYERYLVGQMQEADETLRVLYSLQRGDGLPSIIAWDEM